MKIYIEDDCIEIEKKSKKVIEMIEKLISKSNNIFYCLQIDGLFIYEGYKEYIINNINYIEEVKVITKTHRELVESTVLQANDYIEKLVCNVPKLVEEFYNLPSMSSWEELDNLLEGIAWIFESFSYIDNNVSLIFEIKQREYWNLYAKEVFALKNIIPDLSDGISNNDNILLGDILLYDVLPIFKNMNINTMKILKKDGLDD